MTETLTMTLQPNHGDYLRARGISDDTIERAGIYSAEDAVVTRLLTWKPSAHSWGPAMVIPFDDGYVQVRPDYPRGNGDGKPIKFESPRGQSPRAYFPPGFSMAGSMPVIVTEGAVKSLAISQLGYPCVGLTGVWGWQKPRLKADTGKAYGKRELLPDLAGIDWNGRRVVVVFDSDVSANPMIQLAEARLAEVLQSHGADVLVARLPAESDGSKNGADDYLVRHGADAFRKIIAEAVEPEQPPKLEPMDYARLFLQEHFTGDHGVELRWHRDQLYRYLGTRYEIVPDSDLVGIVLGWLEKMNAEAKPRRAKEIVECFPALVRVPYNVEVPAFLTATDRSPRNIIAFNNGLLDISNIGGDLELLEHSPDWFSTTSLPYAFDPDVRCDVWMSFLEQVFNGDAQRIELLQRWFGLCLTHDTSFQKLLLMIGPKRSGKGTVLRLLQRVVGPDSCVSPTLTSLTGEFGLWQLVGKSVATFPDAHLSRSTDSMRVLEVIKSIVGEDAVSINRKNLPFLPNVRLGVRFVVTVNELPRFSDASDALGARMLVLPFDNSYVGREDRTLESKLKSEASGVLNWALQGLHKLRESGFSQPEKSADIIDNFRRLSAPVVGFVEDCCRIGVGLSERTDNLYAAWSEWCRSNGHEPGAISTFGNHLAAAYPSITRTRERDSGGIRRPTYKGIELSEGGNEQQ